jgi:uncharacterized protein YecE (DUF72 family)
MHRIRIGTCGWSYKDWVGPFYPPGTAAGDYLSFYSERFPIVEVDSSFYRCPSPAMVDGWRNKTPAGFQFSLKVPQTITHEKVLLDCNAEVDEFLTAARRLEEKLLCCVLQFGYFNRSAFSILDDFLARLDPFLARWPKDVPIAVELRNKHWFGHQFLDCLRRHGAVSVLADQAWVPPPLFLVKKFDVATGPFAYLRLLGDREEVDRLTPTLDHTVINRSEQITADAEAIRLLAGKVPVVTFVNNHFAGYAHDTVTTLVKTLEGGPHETMAVTPAR